MLLLIGAANHDERSSASPPKSSTSRTPTGTSASAMAPTSAWVRRSPASKGVSPSSRSTPVCPTTSSITNTRCVSLLQRHGLDEPPHHVQSRVSRRSCIMSWPETRLTIDGELVAAEERDLPQHRPVDRPGDRCRSRRLTGRHRTALVAAPGVRRERWADDVACACADSGNSMLRFAIT